MRKYKTILFDLDGTLLDTIGDIRSAINKTFIKYGFTHQYSNDDVMSFIGAGAKVLINRVLKRFNVTQEVENNFFIDYSNEYSSHKYVLTKPFDGVLNTLKTLKAKGYLLGVISNKPHLDTLDVVNMYFKDTFDIVYGKKDGIKTKPDPEVYNIIKKEYAIIDEEALYVGDMIFDVEFAKNINIDVVIMTYGYGKINKDIGQTYTFKKFEDLLNILEA